MKYFNIFYLLPVLLNRWMWQSSFVKLYQLPSHRSIKLIKFCTLRIKSENLYFIFFLSISMFKSTWKWIFMYVRWWWVKYHFCCYLFGANIIRIFNSYEEYEFKNKSIFDPFMKYLFGICASWNDWMVGDPSNSTNVKFLLRYLLNI